MSRSSGNYSLPAGNPVVTATTISSTWANNTMNDIAAALTQSAVRDGSAAMTGTLDMGSNPIINTTSFAATGAISGSSVTSSGAMTATGIVTGGSFIPTSSTVPVNGLYLPAANTIGLASNTTLRWSVNSAGAHTIASPTAGTALTVSTGVAATTAAIITSSQSQSGSTPALQLQSTAAGGNCTLSICSNTGTPGTNDLSLFQNGTTRDVTIHNEANAQFNIGTNGINIITMNAGGSVVMAAPTSGSYTLSLSAASNTPALVVNGGAQTPTIDLGSSGTAFTMNCSQANAFKVSMTGNVAAGSLTISNLAEGQTVNLMLTQDGTGTRTLGNPTGVKWPGGTVGVLSTPAGSIDLMVFTKINSVIVATLMKAFA